MPLGLSVLLEVAGSWVKSWGKRKEREIESRTKIAETIVTTKAEVQIIQAKALVESASKTSAHSMQWELLAIQQAQRSWKDEFWTMVFGLPLVLMLWPPLREPVKEWFVILDNDVPDWYLIVVAVMIASAFGYRGIIQMIATRKAGR